MDKIETMKRFVAVAQTGSFTQASDQLSAPKSAISTSISRLEAHLNTRLFHRSTRRVTLTEAGSRYLPQCLQLLDELEGLENQFQRESQELSGVIKVDMPGRFFSVMVAPHLNEWFELHPKTRIQLLGADYRIDPIKEQVDCVVRGGELDNSDLIVRRLGVMTMVNCASPSYVQRYGMPLSLEALDQHFVVGYSPSVRQEPQGFEVAQTKGSYLIPMRSLVCVSTTDAYLSACLSGLGIIQLPKYGVEPQLASGELLEVLSGHVCEPMPISILYESRRQQPRRLSEFIDWLVKLFNRR